MSGSQIGYYKNGVFNAAKVEDGALATVDTTHVKIHNGELYRLHHHLIVSSGQHNMVIITGAASEGLVNLNMSVSADEKIQAVISEAPTSVTGGTEILTEVVNVNRNYSNSQTGVNSILNEPTTATRGTVLEGIYSDKYSAARSSSEIILKPSTSYLIEILFAKTSAEAWMGIEFYMD